MSNALQHLLRGKAPVLILDMGLGSREQGFPSQKPEVPLPPLPSQPL